MKKKEKKAVIRTCLDILPVRSWEPSVGALLLADGSYLDLLRLIPRDLQNIAEDELELEIYQFTKVLKTVGCDLKFLSMRFPLSLEQRLHQEVAFLPAAPDIRRQENDILLAARGADVILYDTDVYYNDGEELIGVIKRIWRTNHALPILLVPTGNPKNEIVKAALAVQIKNIINIALSPGEQKDQLEKILTGYYAANDDREDIRAAEAEVAEDTRTLTSFVGQLYDAKQREEERAHTVIVRKKGTPQVLLEALGTVIRVLFGAVSITLMATAMLALLYDNTRELLLQNLQQLWQEICSMLGIGG